MTYLNRTKIYEKVLPFKDAEKIYIFCEGARKEVNYFNYLQGFSSNIDIIPFAPENGRSDPYSLMKQADKFSQNINFIISDDIIDEIWFVIDTDNWNEGDKIAELKSFIAKKNVQIEAWFVSQSNPSFEIWLYYHFNSDKPEEINVKECVSFKDYVNRKVHGGFDNRIMPIYLEQACIYSEKNFESENNQPILFSTEVFRLGKEILKFIGPQLKECIKKAEEK